MTAVEQKNTQQDSRLTAVEQKNTTQDSRLTALETKNAQQDTRLTDLENKDTLIQSDLGDLEDRVAALEGGEEPPPPPPTSVEYVTPQDGDTVSGTITIRVRVPEGTATVGVWGCEGQSIGSDQAADQDGTYSIQWDTNLCSTPKGNGTHNMEAWAFRSDQTAIDSNLINVNIQNGSDSDGDGVIDANDECPGTPAGTQVSANGCPLQSGIPAPIAGQGYTQRFNDEFNTFDSSVWCNKLYWEGAPASGSQAVANGELRLTRTKASNWRNTTVSTEPNCGQANPKEFVRGYFEARMKWDTVRGNGPAFWLLGRHGTNPMPFCTSNSGSDPMCYASELDIIEGFGNIQYGGSRTDDWFSGALHRNTNGHYGVPDTVRSVQVGTGAEMEQYHTYAAKWTSNEVCWYFDEQQLGCRATFDSTNQPMHVILYNWNTSWEDENMPTSTSPDLNVWVDWVRVWQQ
jgi:uncharacterized coiled-coil protein SlyX